MPPYRHPLIIWHTTLSPSTIHITYYLITNHQSYLIPPYHHLSIIWSTTLSTSANWHTTLSPFTNHMTLPHYYHPPNIWHTTLSPPITITPIIRHTTVSPSTNHTYDIPPLNTIHSSSTNLITAAHHSFDVSLCSGQYLIQSLLYIVKCYGVHLGRHGRSLLYF